VLVRLRYYFITYFRTALRTAFSSNGEHVVRTAFSSNGEHVADTISSRNGEHVVDTGVFRRSASQGFGRRINGSARASAGEESTGGGFGR
jgi:hypothetical protein